MRVSALVAFAFAAVLAIGQPRPACAAGWVSEYASDAGFQRLWVAPDGTWYRFAGADRVNAGLWQSRDGGRTWDEIPVRIDGVVQRDFGGAWLAFSPLFASDRRMVLFLPWRGLYESHDAGSTWRAIPFQAPSLGLDVAVELGEDGSIFAAVSYDGGRVLRRLPEGAAGWRDLAAGISRFALSPALGSDGTVFVVRRGRLTVSTDFGEHWRELEVPRDVADVRIAPDFGRSGTVYALGDRLWVSRDRGLSWETVDPSWFVKDPRSGPCRVVDLVPGPAGTALALAAESAVARPDQWFLTWDYGRTWRPVPPCAGAVYLGLPLQLVVSADRTGLLAVAEKGVYRIRGGLPVALFRVGYTRCLVGGRELFLDVAPYVKGDRVYVPVRHLAEALSVPPEAVHWDPDTAAATLTYKGRTVRLRAESEVAEVDGIEQPMGGAPDLLPPGRMMVSARWLAEIMGAEVHWNAAEGTVTVLR